MSIIKEKIALLKDKFSTPKIAEMLGLKEHVVSEFVKELGGKKRCKNTDWQPREIKLLVKLYPTENNKNIAAQLGRSVDAVMKRANILGLKKDVHPAWFKKGNVPKNKGLKIGSSKKPQKPRQPYVPKTKLPVGTLVWRANEQRMFLKTEKGFVRYHNLVWEQANGKIPANHVVGFIDNDPRNCSLDNLCLMHRSKLLDANRNYEKIKVIKERKYFLKQRKQLEVYA